ncbi:peptide-methionine (S)-S-oxide reductase MsrA [Pedobacter insulae]|uniref:Peptide methionine sulfoxide reductase MsrA n=1 Tax=Pedobacter insulae TaxID=414048 RepID=A0A1I2VPS3_9SPHI|nr:peptide-methionine (S)-S-oxide reductase MsrA [Pedobacter insulae]SFG90277.1 peptide-methionine (S)-S-oxide reductase [Pedobacter insulae]
MKSFSLFIVIVTLFLLGSCGSSENNHTKAKLPEVKSTERTAVFAGGCFWGIQEGFSQLKGVVKATSGYAGGTTENPTYEEVGAERTGHAEAVQVIYDPSMITFKQLTHAFFVMHNPTELNRQGPDVGTSYRSIAFYDNAEEKKIVEAEIKNLNETKYIGLDVVTEVEPLPTFYPAENYHQNYVRLHPNDAYVQGVCGPKIEKLRTAMPELLK